MQYYKLTDQNMQTYHGFQWELGKWEKTSGEGELCGPGWIHVYSDPLLAVLLNPIHANFKNPRLFEIEVDGKKKEDHGLKFGFTRVRLRKEISVPEITREQRIAFGILCALKVYKNKDFKIWANNWLSGKDRTQEAAWAVAWAAGAGAATWVATWVAAWAAGVGAAKAAGVGAAKAARTAEAGAAEAEIDLIEIANEAMKY